MGAKPSLRKDGMKGAEKMAERLTRQKFIRNCDAELTPCKFCSITCEDEDNENCWEMAVYNRLAAYEDTGLDPEQIENIIERGTPLEGGTAELMKQYCALGPVEELAALKERTTAAWLQLRTATFSTDKGVADLAKFILSILPEAPKEDDHAGN